MVQRRPRSPSGQVVLPLAVALAVGAAAGLGFFTFIYAEGGSYLVDDPEACGNCHVMRGHLDAWVKSSHGRFASCNDCHAPHATVPKLYCKARNGFFHSLAFTTGDHETNFRITDYNRGVTEGACRYCHARLTDEIHGAKGAGANLSCLRCHQNVGHDR